MLKILLYTALAVSLALPLGGCLVAENRYLKKVEETDLLTKNLQELQLKHTRLSEENSVLRTDYLKLKGEAAALSADKIQLEELLKANSDTLSQNVSDLRQKIAELESRNGKLKDDIAALQKVRQEKVLEVSDTYEKLLSNMKNEIALGQVILSELKGTLTVTLAAAILFDSGKADIRPEGLEILNKLVETLKGSGQAIRIEGHSDNVPISGAPTGGFPTNWELSAARAINVTRYLQLQGIAPRNLSAAAFGEHKPVADNSSREGKARNDRIEIILMAKD